MFVRFVTGTSVENPYDLAGLFAAADEVRNAGLAPHEME
jgi:hypothetical protein